MAMKVFNVGDVLAAADVNEYLVNTRFAAKPANTSRSNTTTLTADPDLTVTVDANKSYYMELCLHASCAAASVNLKFDVTVPSGATFTGDGYTYNNNSTSAGTLGVLTPGLLNLSGVSGFHITLPTGGVDTTTWVRGLLQTAGTAGSATVRWSQDTTSATAVVLETASFMLLKRVA